jgi:hypothetical protein
MTLSNHLVASPATSVPAYCGSSWHNPKITTPSQWATCAKIGWNEPTTNFAHAGQAVGHAFPAILAGITLILLVAIAVKLRRAAGIGSTG